MCRSIKKPLVIDKSVLRCLKKINIYTKKKKIRVYSRRSIIVEAFIDFQISIHNGKSFFFLIIPKSYVGFKFGEFSFSKKRSMIIHVYTKLDEKLRVLYKNKL